MPIRQKYDELKNLFAQSANSIDVTNKLIEIHNLCCIELSTASRVPLASGNGTSGKTYFSFSHNQTLSRPVNSTLFEDGYSIDPLDPLGRCKVDIFFDNVLSNNIDKQSADDITSSVYTVAMEFCCSTDLAGRGVKIAGTYFEKLVGHLYSRHLNIQPEGQMTACELDNTSISIPTDYIFNLGPAKPKFHVPVKTSTRERVVEVWAQQRVLDGAYGVGRFICLLTCMSETELNKRQMKVDDVCIPGQWTNYQLFIAQLKRAYYLDIPNKYDSLNNAFPKIHVKQFGEFFHETNILSD